MTKNDVERSCQKASVCPASDKRNYRYRLVHQVFQVLGLALHLNSCVTTGQSDPARSSIVVERSKGIEPGWIRFGTGELVLREDQWQLVDMRENLANLPLGLKQTQIHATGQHCDQFSALIRSEIRELGSKNRISVDEVTGALEKFIGESSKSGCEKFGFVKEIYYEKYRVKPELLERDQGEFFYRVYVLVTLPKSAVQEVLWQLGDQLLAARDGRLQQLGHLVKAKYPKPAGFK